MSTTTAEATIFIQIASYRDPQLVPTIEDALQKAAHPQRLYFGICLQDSPDCEDYRKLRQMEQCRVTLVDPLASKGTCFARSLTQKLWQGEEYTLQLDSHMRFAANWDDRLIQMLQQCGEKAILTAYCPGWDLGEELTGEIQGALLVADKFSNYGSLLLIGANAMPYDAVAPVPGAFWSGHFSFSKAQVIKDIPYDPNLFFHGEEISYAVRAWTHGYHLFYPHRSVVFHRYGREKRAVFWDDHREWPVLDINSQLRVCKLLGMQDPEGETFGPYGLGEERTLEQYQQFAGVDFSKKEITDKARNGIFSKSSCS